MANMTPDQIRDLSVRVVEGFLNNKVPLSVGLAKEASYNELNMEQIKRACEVSNTITHLKLMQLSEDKTIEYPLCKVAEVMQSLCVPNEVKQISIEKSAECEDSSLEKSAEVITEAEVSHNEKMVYFIKAAASAKKELGLLTERSTVVQSEIIKTASAVAKDNAWIEKMSSVTSDDFNTLSVLVSGEVKQYRDFGDTNMFKEAELKQVNTLLQLYKEAKYLVAQSSKMSDLVKRSDALNKEFTKQAFFSAMARGAGKAAGIAVAGTAKLAGKATIATGTGAAKIAGSGIGLAAISDSIAHSSSGGAGFSRNGAPKNVWDALQN